MKKNTFIYPTILEISVNDVIVLATSDMLNEGWLEENNDPIYDD